MKQDFLSDFPLPNYVSLFLGIITAIYIYVTWNYDYWEKHGVGCKKFRPWSLFSIMTNPYSKPMDAQDLENYKKFGRVYGFYEGRCPVLHVADPELIKVVLVKDFNVFRNRRSFAVTKKDKLCNSFLSVMENDEWKHHRNVLTPTFSTRKMKQMLLLIEECAKQLVTHLSSFAENDEPFDVLECCDSFALDVIATCAFGTKIDSLTNPENEFMKKTKAAFSGIPKTLIINAILPILVEYLPPFCSQETTDYFTKLVNDVITARKQEKNPRKDFLQLMLETKENQTKQEKYPITEHHIVAQSLLFLVAGLETSSTTLSFVMYSLALNENTQEKLIREIDEYFKKNESRFNYDRVAEMQYLDMVIAETLRLYSPVLRLERTCEEDYDLQGIALKKGFTVGIPVYAIHHDEEFYPNPEKFDPERFSPENRSKRNPYTYLPFGQGPRHCIGMRFAQMEMKILLICFFREFRVKVSSETEIPFVRKLNTPMLKPASMKLKVEKRLDRSV